MFFFVVFFLFLLVLKGINKQCWTPDPREEPWKTAPKPWNRSPEISGSLDFAESGEAYPNLHHYGFVRNRALWCCLIYPSSGPGSKHPLMEGTGVPGPSWARPERGRGGIVLRIEVRCCGRWSAKTCLPTPMSIQKYSRLLSNASGHRAGFPGRMLV